VSFWSERSGHPEVWVSDADGRNAMQLTQLGNTAGRFSDVRAAPAWSPDGRFIAFDSSGANRDISVIGVNGGATRRVTVDPAIETQPAWSRDGHWIYFASNRTGRWEVWKISTAGGALVQLTRTGGSAPMESLDARSLYYSKTRPDSTLGAAVWRAHLDGTEETEVIPPPPAPPSGASRVPSWVLVKGGLYYIAAIRLQPTAAFRFTLHFLDLNSGRTKDVGTLLEPSSEAAGMGDLSVSPDGRWAVYGQRDRLESDLMLVENFR
jgi:dipeptidyl aminopeptidase/acylaminoacyl peptidase